MSGVNKVILVGRVGADPELKNINGDQAFCNFSLATSESWQKDGEKQERTEWHRVVAWRKLGELCAKYIKKGRQVYVEGKLQTRSWETEDGSKRYTTEIVANSVQFLGSKDSGEGPSSQVPSGDEEIPF